MFLLWRIEALKPVKIAEVKIKITGLLTTLLLTCVVIGRGADEPCQGQGHAELFMNKCFCSAGYDPWPSADPKASVICNVTVSKIGPCDCPVDDRSFLTNDSWYWHFNRGELGIRCTSLCKSNSQIGAPRSVPAEWKDNNGWKQAGFYKKELTIASERRRHNHLLGRLDEFAEGFGMWHYLNKTNLGDVIEFGAGGYTQLRNILERTQGVTLSSVTLVDPLIHFYKAIQSCSFETGQLLVRGRAVAGGNTTLVESTVEAWGAANKGRGLFDTVICMNVLVYAQDAFKFLETLHGALKPGGLLLFHDRWFDNPAVSSACKMSGFMTNVLQLRPPLLDHFLSLFDTSLFYNTNQTIDQAYRSKHWCGTDRDNERGYFVAGRKKE